MDGFLFAVGTLLVCGAVSAWAIVLFRAACHRDPFRGVKAGNGRIDSRAHYRDLG